MAEPFREGNGYSEAQVEALRRLEAVGYARWSFCGGPGWQDEQGPRARKKPRCRSAKAWEAEENALTLDASLREVGRGRADCVGLHAHAGPTGFVVIDVDAVVKDGVLLPVGVEALRHFGPAYCELSPSGSGLRIVCRAAGMTKSVRGKWGPSDHASLEAYPSGAGSRFARMSGATITGTGGDPAAECGAGIEWLMATIGKAKADGTGAARGAPGSSEEAGASTDQAPGAAALDPYNGAATAPVNVDAMSIDSVFQELARLRPAADDAAEVLAAMKARAADAPRGKLSQALSGNFSTWGGDRSSVDRYMTCEAVRLGANSVEDVVAVWGETAPSERDKFREREDYTQRTADGAARSVLEELRKKSSGSAAPPVSPAVIAAVEGAAQAGQPLVLDRRGAPVATVGNILTLLRTHPAAVGAIGFNELAQCAQRMRSWRSFDQGASDELGRLNDDDITRVCVFFNRELHLNARREDVRAALYAAARDCSYDPLRDRLHEVHAAWQAQGEPSLVSGWLQKFVLVEDAGIEDYVNAVGAGFLVSAVARALRPGTKVDSLLCVEGLPGAGKSSFLALMADALLPGLFVDSLTDASDPVSIVEATRGKLIVELAELAAVRRAEMESLKASITRQSETFRPPYASEPVDVPRRFIFTATTNSEGGYLADEALLRRFWTVRTKASEANPMPLDELRKVAPLLWGEAVDLYLNRQRWWIDRQDGPAFEQWKSARGERLEDGAFFDELHPYLCEWSRQPEISRSLWEIAEKIGDERSASGNMPAQRELARSLRRHGMEVVRRNTGKVWKFTPASALRFMSIDEANRREAA